MPTSSAEAPRVAPLLELSQVAAGYGSEPVVKGFSGGVGPGEVVCVIGPNGAGKSTLLKAVVGVLRPMEGRVSLGGEDVTGLRGDQLARRGVGYVPQVQDVFDTLSVQENLLMGGFLLGAAQRRERAEEVFAVFPALSRMAGRTASKLSGGERKMLAIARVLMLRPRLLVLDEPTANLSPDLSRILLKEHVRRLADEGAAVFMVEQKAVAALEVSDWGYLMVSGATRMSAPAAELLAREDIGDEFLGRAATG